ncbi:MAG TPA: N-acetyltransferase, partial [Parvularcula sp.]|nr:N-acetyltransferase [Parvularcula sp.]
MATITIEPVSGPKGRRDFIRAGKVAYAGDPHFVAPLEFEVGARLDPGANPALKGADVQLFIAKKDGAVAG